MIYESRRAKQYFNSATAHLDLDDKKTMFAARAMQHIYYKMLENIIAADYDVYNNDIKVSKFEKVRNCIGSLGKV